MLTERIAPVRLRPPRESVVAERGLVSAFDLLALAEGRQQAVTFLLECPTGSWSCQVTSISLSSVRRRRSDGRCSRPRVAFCCQARSFPVPHQTRISEASWRRLEGLLGVALRHPFRAGRGRRWRRTSDFYPSVVPCRWRARIRGSISADTDSTTCGPSPKTATRPSATCRSMPAASSGRRRAAGGRGCFRLHVRRSPGVQGARPGSCSRLVEQRVQVRLARRARGPQPSGRARS